MTIFETDTGYLRVWDGSAWDYLSTWQANIPGAWQSWTPVVSQPGSITLTTSYGKYTQINKTIIAQMFVVITGTGTSATSIFVSLPVTAAGSEGRSVGSGMFYDASANSIYVVSAQMQTTTTVSLYSDLTSSSSLFGVAPNIALAANDQIRLTFTYEAA